MQVVTVRWTGPVGLLQATSGSCSVTGTFLPLDLSAGLPLTSAYIPSAPPAPLCAPLCSPAALFIPGNSLAACLSGIYRKARHTQPESYGALKNAFIRNAQSG